MQPSSKNFTTTIKILMLMPFVIILGVMVFLISVILYNNFALYRFKASFVNQNFEEGIQIIKSDSKFGVNNGTLCSAEVLVLLESDLDYKIFVEKLDKYTKNVIYAFPHKSTEFYSIYLIEADKISRIHEGQSYELINQNGMFSPVDTEKQEMLSVEAKDFYAIEYLKEELQFQPNKYYYVLEFVEYELNGWNITNDLRCME